MADGVTTVVKVRDPSPPHGAYLTIRPADVRYSFPLKRQGQAIIQLERSDPNLANLDRLLPVGAPPMLTVERSDKAIPWIGFLLRYDAEITAPYVRLTAGDHASRLSAPHGARTKKNVNYRAATGTIITSIFQDLEARAEPAPFLKYDSIAPGVGGNYEVRADYALSVLNELASQTGWEWGFSYNVSESSVETHLNWANKLGQDRRDEEIWSEQKHIIAASYTLDYANGVKAAVVVGGSGAFGNRPAAVASSSGQASDMGRNDQVSVKPAASSYGLGGTRIFATEQITDVAVLSQRARAMTEDPAFAVEQIGITVRESEIDLGRLGLGDYRTIRLQTTALGGPIERVVRIIGIQIIPATRLHQLECQVVG